MTSALRNLQLLASKTSGPRTLLLSPDQLIPDPSQPRKTFDEGELEELAVNLRANGFATPLLVRPAEAPDRYIIVAGERRWRGAKRAGLEAVPCWLRDDLDSRSLVLLQLSENLHRVDLDPLEEARGLQNALEVTGLSQSALARELGKAPNYVSRRLALLETTGHTRDALESGELVSAETAREFDKLPAPKQQALREDARQRQKPISRGAVQRASGKTPPALAGLSTRGQQPPPLQASSDLPASGGAVGGHQPAAERPRRHLLPPLDMKQLKVLFRKLDIPFSETDLDRMHTLLLSALEDDE